MSERPCPPGWETRSRLLPVGGPSFVNEGILRQSLRAIADKVDGLDSASPQPECQQAYEDFCFAYDRPAWRPIAADDLSACVIVCFAVLDCLGCEMPATDTPYEPRMGRAVTELVDLGADFNRWLQSVGREDAWHDTTQPRADLPSGPAVALVGNNGSEGAEHGFVMLDGLDEDGEAPVLEGGQASLFGRGYRISKARYDFETRAPGQVWARRLSPNPSAWRRLRGWLDLAALPYTQACVLPVET